MNSKQVDEVLDVTKSLFPVESIDILELKAPHATEIKIQSKKKNATHIWLAFYDDIVMEIDGYRWEFDDYSNEAVQTIEKYLKAAAEDRLHVVKSKVIGVPTSKKLIIIQEDQESGKGS